MVRLELVWLVLVRILVVGLVVVCRGVGGRIVVAHPVTTTARPLRLPLLIASVAGGTLAATLMLPWNQPVWWLFAVTASAVLLSELRVVNLPFSGQRWSFAWEEVPVAAALLVHQGSWTVAAVALGVVIAQVLRKQPRIKQVFNTVQFAAAAAIAVAVSDRVGGVAGVATAMAAFWLANTALVAAAIWVTTDRSFMNVCLDGAPLSALHAATNVSLAVLGVWILTANPPALLAMVAPAILLGWALIDQTRRTGETQLLAELVRAHEARVSDATDEVVGALIQVGSRLIADVSVELVVFTPEGPHLYRRQSRGQVACHRMRVGDFAESWALAASSDSPVTSTTDSGSEALLRVGRARNPLGLVRMVSSGSESGFNRQAMQVLRMLSRHAEASLSVDRALVSRDEALDRANAAAETVRSLSDISADTGPALRVLRESAGRLAAMASETPVNQVEVTHLVEELYAVERAVASLCGAVTLASVPGLDMPADADMLRLPTERAEAWTRIGLLEAG
ncbi:MAG TPA: hypothetical protein VNA12_07670 [Mycobacteriales bacterium]|nr:hypothetical protein [Mycobacteriales bacterium]